jgi:activator of HSP90 ATPase
MTSDASSSPQNPSRRKAFAGVITLLALVVESKIFAHSQQSPMAKVPAKSANGKRTYLHQEIELTAPPERIYEILLSSKKFTAFSGAPAEISPTAGGSFSMFGSMIVGRNVELVPNQRIVQAWRAKDDWPEGVYSLVKFELKPQGAGTHLVLDHTGFSEGDFDHLNAGWYSHYWEPLNGYLAKSSN